VRKLDRRGYLAVKDDTFSRFVTVLAYDGRTNGRNYVSIARCIPDTL